MISFDTTERTAKLGKVMKKVMHMDSHKILKESFKEYEP